MQKQIEDRIQKIPEGYSEVIYNGKKYGLTREDRVGSLSIKVFAEEHGGKDFISFNYYRTKSGASHLRACEMPDEKVVHFLENFELLRK